MFLSGLARDVHEAYQAETETETEASRLETEARLRRIQRKHKKISLVRPVSDSKTGFSLAWHKFSLALARFLAHPKIARTSLH